MFDLNNMHGMAQHQVPEAGAESGSGSSDEDWGD
jgi:hypothetical protein